MQARYKSLLVQISFIVKDYYNKKNNLKEAQLSQLRFLNLFNKLSALIRVLVRKTSKYKLKINFGTWKIGDVSWSFCYFNQVQWQLHPHLMYFLFYHIATLVEIYTQILTLKVFPYFFRRLSQSPDLVIWFWIYWVNLWRKVTDTNMSQISSLDSRNFNSTSLTLNLANHLHANFVDPETVHLCWTLSIHW